MASWQYVGTPFRFLGVRKSDCRPPLSECGDSSPLSFCFNRATQSRLAPGLPSHRTGRARFPASGSPADGVAPLRNGQNAHRPREGCATHGRSRRRSANVGLCPGRASSCGPVVHLQLLFTPPGEDAVAFGYSLQTQPGRDFHLADSTDLQANECADGSPLSPPDHS